jgi:WhiA C-terminal HTH domain/WhiA LAGLIDADG-like domain
VTGAERDLVLALRAELAAIDPARACDREAERAGLDLGARGDDPMLARLAVRLGRPDDDAGEASWAGFDWPAAAEHCRMAWLRGVFLSRGSLSLAGGRTHLEFVVPADAAALLTERLAEAGLPAGSRVRRGLGVVTWKSAETVDLFLRRIGAGPTLLEVEARQVARSLRGELNRILNAESANVERTVAASTRQLEAIRELAADGRLAEESAMVRAIAAAREETPEATLTELASRIELHRSTVQRALDRLERLAGDAVDGGRTSAPEGVGPGLA